MYKTVKDCIGPNICPIFKHENVVGLFLSHEIFDLSVKRLNTNPKHLTPKKDTEYTAIIVVIHSHLGSVIVQAMMRRYQLNLNHMFKIKNLIDIFF